MTGALGGVLFWLSAGLSLAGELPTFDFTRPDGLSGWGALHDLVPIEPSGEGMLLKLTGPDPYLAGPARDYPPEVPLWARIRLRSEAGGTAQLFFFREAPREADSVRFAVPAGGWTAVRVRLPALGPDYRLRLDPPGEAGACRVSGIGFEERVSFAAPPWEPPVPPVFGDASMAVRAGDLILEHAPNRWGAFRLTVSGRDMGMGYPSARFGYRIGREAHWVRFESGTAEVRHEGEGALVRWRRKDPQGASWEWDQRFRVAEAGAIHVETRVTVSQDREVLFLPALQVFAGVGTFGTNKHQALFAGVEYLENEPSSSEADLRGPASRRQVPDTVKLTLPLMVLEHDGHYLGIEWEPRPDLCAQFDSPDRVFGSGGHAMGLLLPGSDGSIRDEGELMPYDGFRLAAGEALLVRATLLGGRGDSVVPAVRRYVERHGLPTLPDPGMEAAGYFRLAARGWLDSKIREGTKYYHAWWPGFGAGPAADAGLWMDWLAERVEDAELATRLRDVAAATVTTLDRGALNSAAVGHVRYPVAALVYDAVAENVQASESRTRSMLGQLDSEGRVTYRSNPDRPDYASTHWSREANGLAGNVVARLLEEAAFSGVRELQEQASDRLRSLLLRYRRTVPRGAQTWEIPLHTPDILASAHLVKACTLGFELSGDRALLEEARYWAWTGVPFVYLTPPTLGRVGVYSTIAVLGATSWEAPVWIGLPVQWCGLVYADALAYLARHDTSGPWQQLADGIALSAVQHTWPETDPDRMGLLPDSFPLRAQTREGPAINPATVLSQASRYFSKRPVYDFAVVRHHGWQIHAAGAIRDLEEDERGVRFRFEGWRKPWSWLVIQQVMERPVIRLDGQVIEEGAEYRAAASRLTVRVPPNVRVEIRHGP